MAWAVYLNEQNIADLGVYVMQVGAGWSAPTRQFPRLEIPGRQGAVLVSDPSTEIRTIRLETVVTPSARTIAARRAAEDALKSLAFRGLVRLTVDDDINAPRAIDGVGTSVEVTQRGHPIDATISNATLTIECPDPTWYDVTAQVIGFSATASAVPLGTAPSGGLLRIAAPSWSANVTNPVITYLNSAGVTIQSLTFTTTLTAGTDYLEVDLDRLTATKVSSGTPSNAITLLTAGDFFWLDPMDGDVLNTSYPQLKVTSSAGTPSGTWLGVRRWL